MVESRPMPVECQDRAASLTASVAALASDAMSTKSPDVPAEADPDWRDDAEADRLRDEAFRRLLAGGGRKADPVRTAPQWRYLITSEWVGDKSRILAVEDLWATGRASGGTPASPVRDGSTETPQSLSSPS